MNAVRRATQWAAIALILLLPMVSRGAALFEAFGPGASHVSALGTSWEYYLYEAYSFVFGWLDDPVAASDQYQGAYWSITIAGITVSDPLALLGHALATRSMHWPLVLGAITPIALAMLMGRVFCGWICPVGTILELTAAFRTWIERRLIHVRLPRFMPPLELRWLVLGGGAAFSLAAGIGVFALILPYIAIARDAHLAIYSAAFGFGVLFMVVLMALEILALPRVWCRSLCPTGLVLGLLGRKRVLGVGAGSDGACIGGCNLCARICPVGVDPLAGLRTEECVMCTSCTTACPTNILSAGLSANRPGRLRTTGAAMLVLALFAAVAVAPESATAHHIKGLPHYGYLENYPQVPAVETEISAPPYEIIVITFVFEGLDESSSDTPDDVIFYVAITNIEERESWTGPVTLEFTPADGGAITTRTFSEPLEETVYRTRVTLPDDTWDVTIRIMDEQQTEAHMTLRLSEGVNWYLIASLVTAFALVGAVLAIGRRRRLARLRAIAGTDNRSTGV